MNTTTENNVKTAPDAPAQIDLRDWFAGQAMQGMLAHNSIVEGRLLEFFGKPGMNRYAVCATAAYVVADAMIAARKVKP